MHNFRSPRGYVDCTERSRALLSTTTAAEHERPDNSLLVLTLDAAWIMQGICSQTDPDGFFPEKGVNVADAKQVCARCPVILQCAEYGVGTEQKGGVWGGMSERDRRPFVRAARHPDELP